MSLRRALSLSLLLSVAAGCASVSGSGWRSTVPPQRGPKAYIHASFTGGMFNRSVNAWFRVDRPAYVMVAHLSGEGVIRVLYPNDPTRQEMVEAGKSMRTPTFTALYDAVPSLYSFTASPMATPGARIDSYDGFGHAYIFLIASDEPLRYDAMSQGTMWDEFEVPNYFRSFDPRAAVREFADMVSGGVPYTLRFAESYTTSAFTSYADAQWNCAVFSTLPYAALASLGFYYPYRPYCSGSRYASLFDRYFYGRQAYYPTNTVIPVVTAPPRKRDSLVVGALPMRPEGDTITVTPPRPRRRELPSDATDDAARPNRARAEIDPQYTRPRGETLARRDAEPEPIERPRPVRNDPPERATQSQPERIERSEPVRSERPAPPPRPDPPAARSDPPPARSEPAPAQSEPPPPPPRPRPPGNR